VQEDKNENIMLKVILAALVLVIIAVAGLGIRLLFDRKAEFRGGSCQATQSNSALNEKGISCGCGGTCETDQ